MTTDSASKIDKPPRPPRPPRAREPAPPKPRVLRRALVVEDDRLLAKAVVRCLKRHKLVVHSARSLAAAREVIGEEWDLAVVDVRLPDGSGLELCRLLAGRVPRPVLVAVSGAATAAEGFELAQIGVGEFVEKPFDDETLWGAVTRNAGVPLEVAAISAVGTVPLTGATQAVRHRMLDEAIARSATRADAGRLLRVSRQAIVKHLDDDDDEP